jgi:hypothetical protein
MVAQHGRLPHGNVEVGRIQLDDSGEQFINKDIPGWGHSKSSKLANGREPAERGLRHCKIGRRKVLFSALIILPGTEQSTKFPKKPRNLFRRLTNNQK